MKAKLIFNLPEDAFDFERCNKSLDMALVIWSILELEMDEKLRIAIYDITERYNININDLIE
jgi:replication initiation and membrane attachment protein DnaB